jgi:hypothetical protein
MSFPFPRMMSKVPIQFKFAFNYPNQVIQYSSLVFDDSLKNTKPRYLLLPVEPNLPIPSPVKVATFEFALLSFEL